MRLISTFSIVAFDAATSSWGVAVQSRFLAVGAAVPWARAGAGALATQAFANLNYGPVGLAMLEQGLSAAEVVAGLTASDSSHEMRQIGVVDWAGNAAAFTGAQCLPWAGHIQGDHFCCQGNILSSKAVVDAMASAYERQTNVPFAERLTATLDAGQTAGGDARGQQSAALLVVRRDAGFAGYGDRAVDLRVDDHRTPIAELSRLLMLHRETFGG